MMGAIDVPFAIQFNRIVDELYDAVQEFLQTDSLPDNARIILPSLVTFKLDVDFRLNIPISFDWIKIKIPNLNIDLKVDLSIIYQFMQIPAFPMLPSFNMPDSENWEFLDPSDWTIKTGVNHNPTRYYTSNDLMLDLFIGFLIYLVLEQLYKFGLHKIAINFVKRISFKNIVPNPVMTQIKTISSDIQDKLTLPEENPPISPSTVAGLIKGVYWISKLGDASNEDLKERLDTLLEEFNIGNEEALEDIVVQIKEKIDSSSVLLW